MPDSYHDYARITGDATDPVKGGLVSQWRMNEGSGSTAKDYEDGNDHTINGASWTSTAKTGGNALDFDGTDDYTIGGDPSNLSGLTPITVLAWVRMTELPSTGGPSHAIINRWEGNISEREFQLLIAGDADDIEVAVSDGSNNTVGDTGNSLSANTWYHIGFTFDGSTVRVYRDGSEVYNFSSTNSLTNQSCDTRIGARTLSDGSEGEFFEGQIDDVRIYNEVKSQSEINTIYNDTK